MKKVLLVLITVFALFISADAAELKISNENGNGKVTAVKVNDETVKISASVRLLNEKEPVKLKFVTVALYGPTKPDNYYYETTIESVPYYSYYIDQLRTDENGVVNLDFTVSVKNYENCYLMLGGYNVSDKYEMVISLPPAEPQEVKPMDKPSSSGGGGGSGCTYEEMRHRKRRYAHRRQQLCGRENRTAARHNRGALAGAPRGKAQPHRAA